MNIFTNKRQQQDMVRKEQYLLEFRKMTIYANGVRINEDLAGRLKGYRETIFQESQSKPRIQSSTERPIDFGDNIAAWLDAVRAEARKLTLCDRSLKKVAA